MLIVEVKSDGQSKSMRFDASVDRRVIIGRSDSCDVVVNDSGVSRKHTMLLATPAGWRVQDLGSSNGTYLNGKQVHEAPFERGDVVAVGQTTIRMIEGDGPGATLVIDLGIGRAIFGKVALPLSAAELIWFGFLAAHRAKGEGWVLAGREGHAALAAWTKALLEREWAQAVRTKPLLELANGHDVDDEDLKNVRGKTAQKLKTFCSDGREWMAPLIVPEVEGKNRQRLAISSAAIAVLRAP